MKAAEFLHAAIRAREPETMAFFYADLFEGQFFLHPVMTGLGILIVKVSRPEALFAGLIEFWPWDIEWDGAAAGFRRVTPRSTMQSLGHFAFNVAATPDEIVAELKRRGIAYRMEPRGPGASIPVIDDPEGNFVELFPAVNHMEVPPEALCAREHARGVIAGMRARFAAATVHLPAGHAHSLMQPPY